MKPFKFISMFAALMVWFSCASVQAGVYVDKHLTPGQLSSLDISSVFEVTLEQADACSIRITVPQQYAKYLIADISDGKFTLGLQKNLRLNRARLQQCKFKAVIQAPSLERIRLSGAAQLQISGQFNTEKMKIVLSGATRLNGGAMEAHVAEMSLSGSSACGMDLEADTSKLKCTGSSYLKLGIASTHLELEASGAADLVLEHDGMLAGELLTVNISGAADIDMRNLPYQEARVSSSGASNCDLNVLGRMSVKASGASNIRYRPQESLTMGEMKISGAASVRAF